MTTQIEIQHKIAKLTTINKYKLNYPGATIKKKKEQNNDININKTTIKINLHRYTRENKTRKENKYPDHDNRYTKTKTKGDQYYATHK